MKLLVDAPNLYAASNAKLGHLHRDDGYSTGGLYGFLRSVDAMAKELKIVDPADVCVAFEGQGTVRRVAIDPDYKGDRDPDRRMWYKDHLLQLMRALVARGHVVGNMQEGEADDVIACWAKEISPDFACIMSTDHDMRRLLDPWIFIQARADRKPYRDHMFHAEYGFAPERYVEYLALCGDSSDNVKGPFSAGDAKSFMGNFPTWHDVLVELEKSFPDAVARVQLNMRLFAWAEGHVVITHIPGGRPELLESFYKEMQMNSFLKAMGAVT